nr:immunoglobulin light chain junction region [Macaca mulatta]
CLQDTQLPSTF